MPDADVNARCLKAIDCSDGEPTAAQMALVSASKELAVKFQYAFEMPRLISRATIHGLNRACVLWCHRSRRKSWSHPAHAEHHGADCGHPTNHGEIVKLSSRSLMARCATEAQERAPNSQPTGCFSPSVKLPEFADF